jgi:hypothetical protein
MALLDELDELHTTGAENTSRWSIEQAGEDRPQGFGDDLTLAVIREQ